MHRRREAVLAVHALLALAAAATGTTSDRSDLEALSPPPPASCWTPCPSPAWGFGPAVPSRPRDGVGGAAAAIGGGKIYVSHGNTEGATAILRIYDIATDTWTLGPDAFTARDEAIGAVVGTKYMAFGGTVAGVMDTVEVYDIVAGTWSFGTPMPTPRARMGVAVVDGKVHVVGGSGDVGSTASAPIGAHEVYDPATDTWSERAPLPVPVGACTATVLHGGRIYVLGGWDGGNLSSLNQIYDVATDTWTEGAPLPFPKRLDAAAAAMKGRILLIGGDDFGSEPRDDVDVYDPAADAWCEGPRIMIRASGMAAPAPFDERTIHAIGLRHGFAAGNSAVHQSLVWNGPDLTIACPSDLDLECPADTSPAATGDAAAAGGCAPPVVSFDDVDVPGCGGTTTIARTFTASDGVQAASCVQTIRVLDRTPPALAEGAIASCFPNEAAAEAAAVAATAASDTCSEPVVLQARTSGTCAAEVAVTGTDACGNQASVVYATRIDGTPPRFLDLGPSDGSCIWPPDHRLVCYPDLATEAVVEDECPGALRVAVTGVESDQPDDGRSDGHTEGDALRLGETGACVRAERQGSEREGRTYGVDLMAVDVCGNGGRARLEIRVPHDRERHDECRTSGGRER